MSRIERHFHMTSLTGLLPRSPSFMMSFLNKLWSPDAAAPSIDHPTAPAAEQKLKQTLVDYARDVEIIRPLTEAPPPESSAAMMKALQDMNGWACDLERYPGLLNCGSDDALKTPAFPDSDLLHTRLKVLCQSVSDRAALSPSPCEHMVRSFKECQSLLRRMLQITDFYAPGHMVIPESDRPRWGLDGGFEWDYGGIVYVLPQSPPSNLYDMWHALNKLQRVAKEDGVANRDPFQQLPGLLARHFETDTMDVDALSRHQAWFAKAMATLVALRPDTSLQGREELELYALCESVHPLLHGHPPADTAGMRDRMRDMTAAAEHIAQRSWVRGKDKYPCDLAERQRLQRLIERMHALEDAMPQAASTGSSPEAAQPLPKKLFDECHSLLDAMVRRAIELPQISSFRGEPLPDVTPSNLYEICFALDRLRQQATEGALAHVPDFQTLSAMLAEDPWTDMSDPQALQRYQDLFERVKPIYQSLRGPYALDAGRDVATLRDRHFQTEASLRPLLEMDPPETMQDIAHGIEAFARKAADMAHDLWQGVAQVNALALNKGLQRTHNAIRAQSTASDWPPPLASQSAKEAFVMSQNRMGALLSESRLLLKGFPAPDERVIPDVPPSTMLDMCLALHHLRQAAKRQDAADPAPFKALEAAVPDVDFPHFDEPDLLRRYQAAYPKALELYRSLPKAG